MKIESLIKKFETLSRKDRNKTAFFAAEIVLPIYESYFPGDDRIRKAIESGKKAPLANTARQWPDESYEAAYAANTNANYAAARAAYAAAYAAANAYDDYDGANAAAAIKRAIKAGAKKKTIYDFMCRLNQQQGK